MRGGAAIEHEVDGAGELRRGAALSTRLGTAVSTWPLDLIILAVGLPLLLKPLAEADPTRTLIAVACTFLLGVYAVVATLGRTTDGGYGRRGFQVQITLLTFIIGLAVVLPTVWSIQDRHASGKPTANSHDSTLWIEIAAGRLLHGDRDTSFNTPLHDGQPIDKHNPLNLALYHTASLPFQEELSVPFLLGADAAIGWFDERMVYLLCFGATLAMALALARTRASRLALTAGIGLNPLFIPTLESGQNDVLVLALSMGVLMLARSGRRRAALLLLGVTLVARETTLFLAPFLLLWLAGREGVPLHPSRHAFGWTLRTVGWIALPVLVFAGPFVLWDARALYESLIGFVEGAVLHPFPLRGPEAYGFASFVLYGGLVKNAQEYWPFGIVQLLTAGPIALLLLKRQARDNTLARAVAGYATASFLLSYFSRSFQANSIGYTLLLVVLALCIGAGKRGCGMEKPRSHLSLDFFLLLLVVPAILGRVTVRADVLVAAVVMGLLVVYAMIDVATDGWTRARVMRPRTTVRNVRWRTALALGLLGILVVRPEVSAIAQRHAAQPWNYVNDVTMQVEEGAGFLTRGVDPYAVTYVHTPLVHWYSSPAISAALYHVDRPPAEFVVSAMLSALSRTVLGWFDERFLYLLCLAVCAVLLLRLPLPPEGRLGLFAVVLLNPASWASFVYGEDDVLVLALLLLCVHALYAVRMRTAALWLGLAIASKHTALFMVPPYLVYAWALHDDARGWWDRLKATGRGVWPVVVVPALFVAPFLLWDARDFLDGTIGFLAGTVAHSYPIRGQGVYGFGALVLLRSLVASPGAYYPFTLWTAAAVVPLLVAIVLRLRRWPNVGAAFALYSLLLFASFFFSRFFQDTNLAFATTALLLGAMLPQRQKAVAPETVPGAVGLPAIEAVPVAPGALPRMST